MMIDCDSCTVRGAACTDCVVTFLTIPVRRASPAVPGTRGTTGPGGATGHRADPWVPATVPGRTAGGPGSTAPVDLDDDERAAIDVLASSGLVPPLRMVRAM